VDKCIGCHFFDRQAGKQADNRGMSWGQCRRAAPMLHPINQKTYMIEGVWPHVRDDDWCGEWKAAARRAEQRGSDVAGPGPLLPIQGATPFGSRPAVAAVKSAAPAFGPANGNGGFAASGRGD